MTNSFKGDFTNSHLLVEELGVCTACDREENNGIGSTFYISPEKQMICIVYESKKLSRKNTAKALDIRAVTEQACTVKASIV